MMLSNIASDLAEPVHRHRILRDLTALSVMLAEGWQIEAPVLARMAWAQGSSDALAYHIILARARQRSLLVLPASPELHDFLAEQCIPVI